MMNNKVSTTYQQLADTKNYPKDNNLKKIFFFLQHHPAQFTPPI